jgi:transposase-like protein
MSKVAAAKSEIVARLPLACSNEQAAVEFMEEQRWGASPCCPRCGDTDVSQMKANDGSRNTRFLWRCRGCKQQYTVKIGTVMEDSPIPVRHWCYAFWAACASKKGVSAMQIQRQTGLSYKSALFMMHRIRWAMAPANANDGGKLTGTVEFDETYVGGKPRKGRIGTRPDGSLKPGPAPDFVDRKTPVVAGVERGGRVKARVAINVTPKSLKAHVLDMVDTSARFMTDERRGYVTVGREFEGGHHTVNHSQGEYSRGDVTTNTIEGFFSILKRGITGTYHSLSRKHLHRYLSEFEFRYNTRKMDDGARMALALDAMNGKRLTYAQQVGS